MRINRKVRRIFFSVGSYTLPTKVEKIILFAIGCLATSVLVGWFFKIDALVQIRPSFVPMQFNTAVCFLLVVFSFFSLSIDWKKSSYVFSTILLILSGLSGIQYFLPLPFEIDEMFMEAYLTTGSNFPGRMALSTAICFFHIGVFLFLINRKIIGSLIQLFLVLILLFVSYLSILALVGYRYGLYVMYYWQEYSQMAIHASVGFFLISIALLFRMKSQFKIGHRLTTLPLAVATLIFSLFVVLSFELARDEKVAINSFLKNEIRSVISRSSIALSSRVLALRRMADRASDRVYDRETEFIRDAENYIADFGDFQAIQKLTPNNRIEWIVPKKGNEMVMSKKLNRESSRNEALSEAIERKEARFSPIVKLLQGGSGVLLYLPMYENKKDYKGHIVAVYKLEHLALSLLGPVAMDDFHIQIQSGKTSYNLSPFPIEDSGYKTEFSITSHGLDWNLTLYPSKAFLNPLKTYRSELALLFGFFISFLMGGMMYLIENLLIANKKTKAAYRTKGEFLANISHEIRTPLNAVIGMSNLIDSHLESKENKEKLKVIQQSGQSLLDLINDVLDFSKLEADRVLLEQGKFEIRKTLRDLHHLFKAQCKTKNIDFQVQVEERVPMVLVGDEIRIKQVLTNFIGNAVKFTQEGHVKVGVRLAKQVSDSKVELTFFVEDTGIGISESDFKHLFKDFSQVDASTTRKYGGTGLGLSISKALVELMDGKIAVSSEKDKGSCFEFSLPLHVSEDLQSIEVPKEIEAVDFGSLRVLTAEDNRINQIVIKGILERIGIKTDLVANGIEVLDALDKFEYDVILMDCHMPDMDGFAATRAIIEKYGDDRPTVMALTASSMEEDRQRCKEAGMDDFLSKPVDLETLKAKLASVAASKNSSKKIA